MEHDFCRFYKTWFLFISFFPWNHTSVSKVGPYGPPPPAYPYPGYPPPGYAAPRYPPPQRSVERGPTSDARPPEPRSLSYAEEKPAAYQAFKTQAVRVSSAGAEVSLSNGMCQDRHVEDFLLCFQCWLGRTYGDPSAGPWRLRRLDLSRNSLSDAHIEPAHQPFCSFLEFEHQ